MDRVRLFRVLERAAQPLRRAGLGRVVDRARGRFERGLGTRTAEIGGLRLTGAVALHSDYLEELATGREGLLGRLWAEAIGPADVVADVGAHLGWMSLLAVRAGAREVHAVDANPDTLPLLRRNLADNDAAVIVHPVAAGREAGTLEFWRTPAGDESSLVPRAGATPVEVRVVRLADIVPGADVVKVDVEGAELDVLAGMDHPPRVLFIECNPPALRRAGSSPEALWDAIEGMGLRPQVIDEAAGVLRGRDALPAGDHYSNLVCERA
jgi:FkbM family methyltransferase